MTLVSLGVVWAGYLVTWYGYAMMKGPGMGFTDLLLPSRVSKAEGIIKGWGANNSVAPVPNGGSFIDSIGVQPGSDYYPKPAGGGLPSKPPLGSTPPAGYGN